MGKATRRKSAFHLVYSVTQSIQCSPETLWKILSNAKNYPQWNSTVLSLEGEIRRGGKIKLVSSLDPDRVFALRVSETEEAKTMVWQSGGLPMFRGRRTFSLKAKGKGSTEFTMTEHFSGLMLPMIAGSLPDMRENFETFAGDLAKQAETLA